VTGKLARLAGWQRLFARERLVFGQIALWLILLACALLAARFAPPPAEHARTGDLVSVLSFLPDSVLRSHALFHGLRVSFCVLALAWAFGWLLPWSSWGATATFTALMAQAQESSGGPSHSMNLITQVLWVFALWFQLEHAAMAQARRRGDYWHAALQPRWVVLLPIGMIGWLYTLSGMTKLVDSGLGWADGLSMQLWVLAFGRRGPLFDLMIEQRALVAALQWLTLVFETSAVLCVAIRPLRWLAGAMLTGFHFGQQLVFDFPFYGNQLLLVLFLLPTQAALHALADRVRRERGSPTTAQAPPAIDE
jgi:hypothetical protein